MKFSLEVVNVFRDFVQGLYGNRIPFDDEDVLAMLALWDELVRDSAENPESLVKFGAFEIGGAHPQVTALYRNHDFMEEYRVLRAKAPHTALRPLFRGANAFLLAPIHKEDLKHVLTHLAEDVANPRGALQNATELLRVKIFDSQGVIKEVESSVTVLGDLRKEGYWVSAEIAIPYSNTKDKETQQNIYPDDLFVQKVVESYQVLAASGLPLHLCRISLKDMVGQLDPLSVRTLLPKIINALAELQLNNAQVIPFGLHLHDTGMARDAYVAAIDICQKKNYPLTIDTVDCDPYKPGYVGKSAYQNTGFASLLEINDACLQKNIDLKLTEKQIALLKQMSVLNLTVARKYAVRRVESLLSGIQMQRMDMPGGAYSSFSTAVFTVGLAKNLKLSETDALLLAGYGLNAVSPLMGYPFAVTPGFQNKQIAALHLIKNMIETKMLVPGQSLDEMKNVVLQTLTDAQVEALFLKGLNPVVADFLKGEMPAETIQKKGTQTNITIHPTVRAALQRRTVLLTATATSKLVKAREVAESLMNSGAVKPTRSQEEAATRQYPNATPEEHAARLRHRTIQTLMTWGLELGDPNHLRAAIQYPWKKEPDGSHHQNDTDGYQRALKKIKNGLNPVPDTLEKWYAAHKQGKLSFKILYDYTTVATEREVLSIHIQTMDYIIANGKVIGEAMVGSESALSAVTTQFYEHQKTIINEKESRGEYFILSKKRRLDIACAYFAENLQLIKGGVKNTHAVINKTRAEIESFQISSSYGGKVVSILVAEKASVNEGQAIAMIEVMKMEMTIPATRSGVIEKIHIKPGDTLEPGKLMMDYQKPASTAESVDASDAVIASMTIDFSMINGHLYPLTLKRERLDKDLINLQTLIEFEIGQSLTPVTLEDELTADLQRRGFYGTTLSLTDYAKQGNHNEIHVIGNRAGCAIKLFADLKQANDDVRLLYVKGDKDAALIKHAKPGESILVDSYTDHQIVLAKLEEIAQANPGRDIYFHPGWGFLSEDDKFVAALEKRKHLKNSITFVGPPSHAMRLAGGKKTFRDVIAKTAPEFNPTYFGNTAYSAEALLKYIQSGFQSTDPIHPVYWGHFQQVREMGGDVRIKAVAGGGGMGIVHFVDDPEKTETENYHRFMSMVQQNVAFSERQFNNGEMLTEQSINGVTRHIEVQAAMNKKGAIVLGVRDCTLQIKSQKTNETNVISGDYEADVMLKTLQAAKKIATSLAEDGYCGVCTIEALTLPDGTVKFLEANTRLQVEHMVTEEDIRVKTGKSISLPLLNLALSTCSDLSPAELLEKYFNFTNDDLTRTLTLNDQRIEHIRLNSSCIDFQTGKEEASFFWRDMWPSVDTIAEIAKKTGTQIIVGDIGDGNFNKQTGAICGQTEQVQIAAIELLKVIEVARVCLREEGTLSLGAVLKFASATHQDGRFTQGISTRTQDEFLDYLSKHQGAMTVNVCHPQTTPEIEIQAFKAVFDQFLLWKQSSESKTKQDVKGKKNALAL